MIVVTGAAGFIGSNLVAALNDAGRSDLLLCDALGAGEKWRNIAKRLFRDIVAPDALMATLDKIGRVDVVFHLGADSSTLSKDADAVMKANFKPSLALLDWCAEKRVPLVYASSAATYGDGSNGFADDDDLASLRAFRPLNLYGFSKHLFDLVVAERRARRAALPPRCIGLKYFNVHGPNEHHKGEMASVAHKIHADVVAGRRVDLFPAHAGKGEPRRDFIHVFDAVDITLWAADRCKATQGLLNVGTGEERTFADVARAAFAAAGRAPDIGEKPMPDELAAAYQYVTRADVTKLRAAGWTKAFMSLEAGVKATYDVLGRTADPFR
jgi:ADP-L-glycero-D-manno-heptose 6-epimerase